MRIDKLCVSLDRIQIVQIRIGCERLHRCRGRKTFVCHDDAFMNAVLFDKGFIGCEIQHIAGKALGTDRLHSFQIKRIQHRDISRSLRSCLP